MIIGCVVEIFTRISLMELFTRGIFEGFLLVLANYAFARKKVVLRPYVITSLLVAVTTYFIKLLPISFGVPMVLSLIGLIFLCVFISKIDIFTSVKGAMMTILTLIIIETLNFVLLGTILDEPKYNQVIADPYQMLIAGIPGIILFAIVVITAYFLLTRKAKNRGENGTTGDKTRK